MPFQAPGSIEPYACCHYPIVKAPRLGSNTPKRRLPLGSPPPLPRQRHCSYYQVSTPVSRTSSQPPPSTLPGFTLQTSPAPVRPLASRATKWPLRLSPSGPSSLATKAALQKEPIPNDALVNQQNRGRVPRNPPPLRPLDSRPRNGATRLIYPIPWPMSTPVFTPESAQSRPSVRRDSHYGNSQCIPCGSVRGPRAV